MAALADFNSIHVSSSGRRRSGRPARSVRVSGERCRGAGEHFWLVQREWRDAVPESPAGLAEVSVLAKLLPKHHNDLLTLGREAACSLADVRSNLLCL